MNRGVNRNPIFTRNNDRDYFLRLVTEYKQTCDARVYHWVLMGNHYHLLIEVAFDNLRYLVGGIQQSYAQYHHREHRTSGVFWQGRFNSKPVEIGSYLVSCGRYIERNPVRAGLVEIAWDYPWSSAAHYVTNNSDGVTDVNPYIGKFTESDRKQYGEALVSGVDESAIRKSISRNIIGSRDFSRTVKKDRGHYRPKRGKILASV